ncbi:MAG: hypothetical protein Q8M83_00635 [bacterium]|nr:hypothetical protein [bacterium]
MIIEIDQSGKIESTNKKTVIAFSNGKNGSICISAKDKKMLQQFFREIGKPRVFVYKVFTILIFLLIKRNLAEIGTITIDKEYPGWEHLIKDYLLREIRRTKYAFESHQVVFMEVGKHSRAHKIAYNVACKGAPADITVTATEVLRYIVK